MASQNLTISEIELSIQLLDLDIERQLAPPMADLIRHSHEIAATVDSPELVKEIRDRLLSDAHPFKERLGLMVLRHIVNRYAPLCIPIFIPFLNNSHPWNRYEAMWGLVSSRVSDEATLQKIQNIIAANSSDHEADMKLKSMGTLLVKAQAQRRRECANLVTTGRSDISNLSFEWPNAASFEIKAQGTTYFHGRGVLISIKETSMIQFAEYNKSEIALTIVELEWDEDMSLLEYIKEMISLGGDLKSAIIKPLEDGSFYSEYHSSKHTSMTLKKSILFGKRFFEYTAEMDPRDEPIWGAKFREIIQKLKKT